MDNRRKVPNGVQPEHLSERLPRTLKIRINAHTFCYTFETIMNHAVKSKNTMYFTLVAAALVAKQPNIVLMLTDDQDLLFDSVSQAMPFTKQVRCSQTQ